MSGKLKNRQAGDTWRYLRAEHKVQGAMVRNRRKDRFSTKPAPYPFKRHRRPGYHTA